MTSSMEQARDGFIVQPTYRIEAGRPVIHLWGKLRRGGAFLIRDDRTTPHFWIRSADLERARQLGVTRSSASDRLTAGGEKVVRIEVPVPADTPPLRERLRSAGIPSFEADVRFAMRFLIDRGIRGSLVIAGAAEERPGGLTVFENPEIEPGGWVPELDTLSLDIETDPGARRLLSVGLHGCGAAEVLLLAPEAGAASAGSVPRGAVPVRDEAEMLRLLARRIRELDPDVLTGWNVADFDFEVLLRRATELGVSLGMGRAPGATRRQPGRFRREATRILIPGRLVLDGIDLLRGAFIRMERHSLDFVARKVLGEGKTIQGRDRAEEILQAFREDRERFVEYNLADARLVSEILQKLRLVELAVERSRLTGLPPDRVASSVAAFDFLYLSRLGRRGVVAPSVSPPEGEPPAMGGGHVMEPTPGLYENVIVLDVKSLYPSLIRSFQLDPLGYVSEPGPNEDLIVAPNGAAFRRQPGILTDLLDELFPRREAARRAGDEVTSHAVKILMNSFFGVLGTPACRFFNPEVANAITSFGRELLLWSRRHIESSGFRVLYGDTDSLFVAGGAVDAASTARVAGELVTGLDRALAEYLRRRWNVESRLEVEFERLYLRLFLPPVRHGKAGARKRYAGLVDSPAGPEVVFTGLEAVRRDWTELARGAQRELYGRLFRDRPVEGYLRSLVADLRAGGLDDRLVYRKALRKAPEAYTATTPPHVVAARKMRERPGRIIDYVMTRSGPEPASERTSPFDYEHYVKRQLRPVAEPVLAHLGLSFDRVVGDDRQMELF